MIVNLENLDQADFFGAKKDKSAKKIKLICKLETFLMKGSVNFTLSKYVTVKLTISFMIN